MYVGPLKVTPGVEATLLFFCPIDHHELVRMDALGELEAEAGAGTKTFEEFCESENVIGVIHAKTGARGRVITEEGVDVVESDDEEPA
jgi:hypothetical protein